MPIVMGLKMPFKKMNFAFIHTLSDDKKHCHLIKHPFFCFVVSCCFPLKKVKGKGE